MGWQSGRWWSERVGDSGGRRHGTVLLSRHKRVVNDAVDRLFGLLLPGEYVCPVVRVLLKFSTVGRVVARIVVQELIAANRVVYLHLIVHFSRLFFLLLIANNPFVFTCFFSCDERIGNLCYRRCCDSFSVCFWDKQDINKLIAMQ